MLSDRYDQQLLTAASTLAGATEVSQVLAAVRGAMELLEGVDGGLGVYESRRQELILHLPLTSLRAVKGLPLDRPSGPGAAPAAGPAAEGESIPIDATEASRFLNGDQRYVSTDLHEDRPLPIHEWLHQLGVRQYASFPLRWADQFLGTVCACAGQRAAFSEPELRYLERLAMLLAPALWNCLVRDRLARGDRRRETLIELSHAINTSLKLVAVLRTSSRAIARLEGHCMSIIGLLSEAGHSLLVYRHDQFLDADSSELPPPTVHPIETTPMRWIMDQRQAYESPDLKREKRFAWDAEFEALGVRRYVGAPMFVRGRIIGAFFMGTEDPHPALTTDVWLYENIALQLALAIDNARQYEELHQLAEQLQHQNVYLREEIDTEHNIEGIIGRSPPMVRVFDQVNRVAGTDSSVLILGDTGVGKELVARAIHARSGRANHPLVKVNCAAIPEGLFESELFGHERGAFTSATSRRIGRFELARDGTLFLDEIGELPLGVQVKLLRVLQDGEFDRVGGTTTLKTNARIIAATNRDLLKAVAEKTFRSDLYYRLNVFPIHVPSLKDHKDDIPLLVQAFIAQFNRRMGKQVDSIHPLSLRGLIDREWHGNVRELRHVIERAMVLCDGSQLLIEDGIDRLERSHRNATRIPHLTALPTDPARAEPALAPDDRSGSAAIGTMADAMRSHIERALDQTGGVIDGPGGAARLLGLKPSTLRSRMQRLGIRRSRRGQP